MFDGFWMGFIVGGIVCVSVFEFIQFIIMSAVGVRSLEKELKRKNDLDDLRMRRLKSDIQERNERKEPRL